MDEVTAVTEIQRTVRVAQEQQFAEACESGDVDSVREFLEHGVSVTAEVASQGRTPALPLIVAARAGHAECVRAILDAGASVDEPCGPERETAIHVAATCGCIEAMEVLIAASGQVDPLDIYGRSPLLMSCIAEQPASVALLLKSKADPDLRMTSLNPGATPLYAASFTGCLLCVKMLCEAGATVDAKTEDSKTPMLACCQEGHLELAMLLSSYGAERGCPAKMSNLNGSLAEYYARANRHRELLKWLKASAHYSPLHHVEVLSRKRAVALLRSGDCSPIAGTPSAADLARTSSAPAAEVILRAVEPWSPATHELWDAARRERAVTLCKIGYLLAFAGLIGDRAFVDVWVLHVMPQAMSWAPLASETADEEMQLAEARDSNPVTSVTSVASVIFVTSVTGARLEAGGRELRGAGWRRNRRERE